jgi:hypothetical protein
MRLTAMAAAALLGAALQAGAQTAERPAVVELYTSQGCSSCPPADALLRELAKRDNVIALALHVDYWDYIGWADTFADPAHAERQRAYARAAGEMTIYTPQMVVNGRDKLVGANAAALEQLLAPAGGADGPLLVLSRSGGSLTVRAEAAGALPDGTVVQLVRFRPEASVTIERGENAGRTLDYANIVTSWQPIGEWDGLAPLEIRVRADGEEPAAVLIQAPGPGPILAAALTR